MGLFDFKKAKKGKKTVSNKKQPEKQEKVHFDRGSDGIIFNAKIQIITKEKEYAQEVSKKYLESIKATADIKGAKKYNVIKSSISKPEKIESEEGDVVGGGSLFKVLLEFEIGVKKKTNMFDFCFEFMPFYVEVLEPMTIPFNAFELTDYVTSIQATLHKVDEELKKAKMVNTDFAEKYQIMTKNVVRLLRNNVLLSLKEKNKSISDLSKSTGVPEEQLKPFIENMVKDKEIKLEKDKYSIKK